MSSKSKNLRAFASSRETKTEEAKPALVPKLRFPAFRKVKGWELVTLQEASVPVSERVGKKKLTPVSISAGIGFVPQAEKFGRDISGNQYQLYTLVRDGDFVFNKGNSLKFPQGCVYLLQGWDQVAAPNVFICFRLKDGYSNGFFQNCFEQNQHGKQLKRHITSGARSNGLLNISKDTFFGVEIPTPSLAEQQKIASCLSSIDELIATQARKLDALKTHKKGLMQQLFPREGETQPRLRFPEFQNAGEWVEEKLEALAKRGSGHTPNKSKEEYYNGGIRWVSLADSKRLDNGLITETTIEISEQGIKKSSAVLHPAGSVILSRDAGVGKSAVMGESMAVSQHFIVWTCDNRRLSNWFLYYILQIKKPVFENVASGSTIKTIGLPFFKEMRVAVPQVTEQQRIASCLTSLDDLIAAQTQKHEALKTHKKGLMQQLFPSPEEVEA
jgi:type I restriction enzyme S subunit